MTIKTWRLLSSAIIAGLAIWLVGCARADTNGSVSVVGGDVSIETPAVSPFGIQSRAITPEEGLRELVELDVRWVRRNGILWSEIERTEGQLDWGSLAAFDSELKAAQSAGIEVILVVRSTPDWAQAFPGIECGPVAREKLASFAAFMTNLVSRYSGQPFNVRYWELWNEPDVHFEDVKPTSGFGCWGDRSKTYYGGEYYAEMLKAAYPAIKAADPAAQVLIGGLLLDCDPRQPPAASDGSGEPQECSSARFMEGVLQANGADFFDGISFHAYDYYFEQAGRYGNPNWNIDSNTGGPSMIAKISYLNGLLEQYGVAGKFLINSEQALLCLSRANDDPCSTESFERTKSAYVVQSYTTALSEGLRANIWYSLRGWRGSGLVGPDLSPAPAYRSYQVASALLGGTLFIRPIDEYPGIFGYGFQREAADIWVIWSILGDPHRVELPLIPTRFHDMYGTIFEGTKEIVVDMEPLYVIWESGGGAR